MGSKAKRMVDRMLEQFHLLYATTIQHNITEMRRIMTGTKVEVLSPFDVSANVHARLKSLDPVENARIRAMAYYRKMGIPSFAVESGLYIDGLPEEEQPAARYRKFRGIRLSDSDCLDYYSTTASRLGGSVKAMFLSAVCLVVSDDMVYELCDGSISARPFLLTNKAHPKQLAGNPFASLAVDPDTGKYWADDPSVLVNWDLTNAYRDFFTQALKDLNESLF